MEYTGQVQVVPPVGLPDGIAVAQVQAMDGAAVGRGEDDLAVLDDGRRILPVAAQLGEAGIRILPGPHDPAAPHEALRLIAGVRFLGFFTVGECPAQAPRQ